MSSRAFISLGSNIGDRAGFLLLAIRSILNADLPLSRLSNIYETSAVDFTDQPAFLNMVAELHGRMPGPREILTTLHKIENELGRTREINKGPRTIDLDLLVYGDLQIESPDLILPHPRLHLRRFVLVPLAELAPHLIVPGQSEPVANILLDCIDEGEVQLWQGQ